MDSREQFEELVYSHYLPIEPQSIYARDGEEYLDPEVQTFWKFWQARDAEIKALKMQNRDHEIAIGCLEAELAERDALIAELSKDAERFVSIAEYERVVAGGNWLIQVIDAKGGYYNSYFKEPPAGMPDIVYPTRLEALRASVDKAIKMQEALALKVKELPDIEKMRKELSDASKISPEDMNTPFNI